MRGELVGLGSYIIPYQEQLLALLLENFWLGATLKDLYALRHAAQGMMQCMFTPPVTTSKDVRRSCSRLCSLCHLGGIRACLRFTSMLLE